MTAAWHVGPIEGARVLVAARLLARDPRLPLLHDHRPEDDSREPRRAPRLRRRGRTARDVAHRAADDRVRDEGRDPRRARARLRGARRWSSSSGRHGSRRSRRSPATRRDRLGGRGSRRRARVRRARRRRRDPGTTRRRRERAPAADGGRAPRDRRRRRARASPPIDDATAQTIARDVLVDLRIESDALRRARPRPSRGRGRAARGSRRSGRRSGRRGTRRPWRSYDVDRMRADACTAATYQGPPIVVAHLQGTLRRLDVRPDRGGHS